MCDQQCSQIGPIIEDCHIKRCFAIPRGVVGIRARIEQKFDERPFSPVNHRSYVWLVNNQKQTKGEHLTEDAPDLAS